MNNLRSFRAVLLREVDPDITSWNYSVANLPQAKQTNAAGLVKCLSLISSNAKQEIVLRFESAPSNRVTRKEPLDKLLLISLADFRLRWPAKSPDDPPRLATGKENGDYITRLLTTGVGLNGIQYHFFGHSNSQLKSRSCFLYAASKEEISTKVEAMGDLSKLKSVGKKAKRIGLLFSSADMALALPPERCEDIEDVKRDGYIFTDGCGLISLQLARQLAQRRKIIFRDKRYLPSVFQIRYRGYKGVLTLDRTLQGQVQVQFRESMRKFKDASDHSFAVVDYSKPYAFGSLNDEVVVLLHTLGVSEEMLLRKQQQHLDFLSNVSQGDSRAAFQFLSYCDRINLAEKLLLEGSEPVRSTLGGLVRQEYAKMLNKRDEQRCRILIPKSRLLFGVCDPASKNGRPGKLREGECFVRITHDGDGVGRTIIATEVMVTRNPCLHPGDLQKFKAVDIPEFSGLVDCIVFSTQGRRPSADLMSGGDLDGDKCKASQCIHAHVLTITSSLRHLGPRYHPADNGGARSVSWRQRVCHFRRRDW
ncbi:RdRP-domain-containing protein [Byssothecium circinans]|uniref:RNA-dependent RNA polymerase n=1 Tax=Byssothecium circinans TaxID=147558 RepID=A0A6A5TBM9_9PLEO|nr:RdRP-domain-containing protein [Byssothecium circinans]